MNALTVTTSRARIHRYRRLRLLTQTALCKLAGIDRKTLWKMEKGEPVTVSRLAAVAKALDVDPSKLVEDS